MPLPVGDLNAYDFRNDTRNERLWSVRGRYIEIYPVQDLQRTKKRSAQMTVRLTPWADAPRTLFEGVDDEPSTDSVSASLLVFEGSPPDEGKVYTRWIGDRQNLEASMLVYLGHEHRVTLLLHSLIQANGIRGVVTHALGDVDGDGLSDLAILKEPFLDSEERGKDVGAELYLTRDGQGIHRVTLGSLQQIVALSERCFVKSAGDDVFSSEHWQISAARGSVVIQLAGPGGCGRRWSLDFRTSRTTWRDLP